MSRQGDAPHRTSSGKCKLEQQGDITTHELEGQESGTLAASKAAARYGATGTLIHCQWEDEMAQPVLRHLAVYYKILGNQIHSYHMIQQLHSSHRTKGVENLCSDKNLHMDVYSSFIHN